VPFTINRSNTFASRDDISFVAAFDPADAVNVLVTNEFERVLIDRIDFSSSVTTRYQQWTITAMAVSVNGGPFRSPAVLSVPAGATVKVRVRMRPYRSTSVKTSYFTMTVPANAAGRVGSLVVTGGVNAASGGYPVTGSSLTALINGIRSLPRNDELVARLVLEPQNGGTRPFTRTAKNRHSQAIAGQRELAVEVR
jgi:hypothetical protein